MTERERVYEQEAPHHVGPGPMTWWQSGYSLWFITRRADGFRLAYVEHTYDEGPDVRFNPGPFDTLNAAMREASRASDAYEMDKE